MKTMTCRQLGGACDKEFHAETFEAMGELSRQHAMDMLETQDASHQKAMEDMQELMKDPDAMGKWFESKRQEFDDLPQNPV